MGRYRRAGRRVLALVLIASTAGCGSYRGDSDILGKTIRYQVEYYDAPEDAQANSALSIEYSSTEGRQQQSDVGLPWTKVVGTAESGFTASVKAQFDGYGTIACRIVADGKVIEQQWSPTEPYPTVECSA